jgi:flagellar motor switch protein FliN/FliY
MKMDALAESGNISMGSAATALSHLLGHKVEITTPRLSYTTLGKIRESFPVPCVLVRVRYNQGLEGSNVFILSDRDAGVIANMMMGDADKPVPPVLDELYLSALSEAMNQMMGSSATAMSEMFNRLIDITPPEVEYVDLRDDENKIADYSEEDEVIQIAFDLSIGEYINSTMLQIVPPSFAEQLVADLLGSLEGNDVPLEMPELSAYEADAITEVGTISMGSAATTLSLILNRRVDITAPKVTATTLRQVQSRTTEPVVTANVQYLKGLTGDNVLIVRERDASVIASLMMGETGDEPGDDLDEIRVSAVSEALNQMMGASCTALADVFSRPIEIAPLQTELRNFQQDEVLTESADYPMVQVSFRIEIKDLIDSELVQLIPLDFAQDMVSFLMESMGIMKSEPEAATAAVTRELPEEELVEEDLEFEEIIELPDLPEPETQEYQQRKPAGTPAKKTLTFDCVQKPAEESRDEGTVQLDLIRDIPVQVTGLLGRRVLSLKELMAVTAGSVMELECPADAPVDILANGKLVARGEVVVYDDRFGIKITEIVQPWQRN